MTARTLNFLNTNYFQAGQNKAISSGRQRDFVDTLGARTPFAVVTQPEYGADPTGVSNSTAAFTAANAASKVILVPPGTYRLANFQPLTGTSVIGMSGHNFFANPNGSSVAVTLIPNAASTTNIFDMHLAPLSVRLEGMDLNGSGATTCSGITSGGKSLTLRDLTVRNFTGWGLGGSFAGGNADSFECHIHNCDFLANGIGIGDIIDTWVFGGSLTSNGTNIQFVAGDFSGEANFVGVRIEWSTTGYGFQITGGDTLPENPGTKTKFIGCQFDRNFNGAVDLNTCKSVSFTGCGFWRNGAVSATGTVSTQVRINGCTNINFTGCQSNFGRDDGNTGIISPPVWARFAGTNTDIQFVNNDLSGYSNTLSNVNWFAGSQPTTRFILSKNLGTGTAAQDVDTR